MQKITLWSAACGLLIGALVLRLVALLFAARPDNLIVRALLAITAPLVWPFRSLDRWAHQPQIGARLELATITAIGVIVVIAIMALVIARRAYRSATEENHA